jgi:hypothetical protein
MTSQNNIVTFNQLFEYRINLQDEYPSEVDIIKQLKNYLIDNNIDPALINTILFDFYKFFNMDIAMEVIQDVEPELSENANLQSLLESFLDHPVIEEELENLSDNEPEQQPIHSGPVFIFSSGHVMNQPIIQPAMLDAFNSSFISAFNSSIGMQLNLQPLSHNHVNEGNIHQNMINILDNLLSGLSQPVYQENVKVTTDEEDILKLKTRTLEEKLEDKCTVCMGDMIKDELVTELPCNHIFHKDCIEPYLKEYTYKCPVCREEVGKVKRHI